MYVNDSSLSLSDNTYQPFIAFVKHFMSPEGLKEHATKTMVNPLRQYIEAYANNGENPVAVEELTKKFSSGILNAWRFNPTEEPFLGAKTQ